MPPLLQVNTQSAKNCDAFLLLSQHFISCTVVCFLSSILSLSLSDLSSPSLRSAPRSAPRFRPPTLVMPSTFSLHSCTTVTGLMHDVASHSFFFVSTPLIGRLRMHTLMDVAAGSRTCRCLTNWQASRRQRLILRWKSTSPGRPFFSFSLVSLSRLRWVEVGGGRGTREGKMYEYACHVTRHVTGRDGG